MWTTAGRVPPSCSSLHSSPCSACLQAAVKGGFGLCSASARRERTTSPSLRQVLCGNAADPRAEVTLSGGEWGPGRELLQEGGLWQSQAGARLDSAGGRHWGQGLAESAKCLPSPHLLSLVPGGRWCHQHSLFGRGQELGLPRQCCLWGRWPGELETVVLGPWVPLPPPFPGGSARPGTLCFPVHSPRCWAACPPRRRRGISQPSPDRIKEKYTSKQIAAS